jgi:hypothetical protein
VGIAVGVVGGSIERVDWSGIVEGIEEVEVGGRGVGGGSGETSRCWDSIELSKKSDGGLKSEDSIRRCMLTWLSRQST